MVASCRRALVANAAATMIPVAASAIVPTTHVHASGASSSRLASAVPCHDGSPSRFGDPLTVPVSRRSARRPDALDVESRQRSGRSTRVVIGNTQSRN